MKKNELEDQLLLLKNNDEDQLLHHLTNLGKRIQIERAEKNILKVEIEKLLDHPSEIIREAAIRVLGFYWALPEYRETALNMFQNDLDEDVQTTALMAWASTYKNTNNKDVISFLYKIAKDISYNMPIRIEAYANIFTVSNIPASSWPKTTFEWKYFEKEANWELVKDIIKQ